MIARAAHAIERGLRRQAPHATETTTGGRVIADRILSLLVGRPVLSVLIGGAALYALGRYLGWWVPVVIVGAAAIDFAVLVRRWPSQWRPW